MVKVVDRSSEEVAKRERGNKLVRIAKEVFGEKFKICDIPVGIYLQDADHYIQIKINSCTMDNEIAVDNPDYLNDAIKLAEAYEKSGESEFAVKKYYD